MAKYSTWFLLVLCQFVQTGQIADRHLDRLDLSFRPVVRDLSGLYFPVKCIIVFLSMGVLLVKSIIKNGQILHLFCARSPSIRKNGTNRALSSWPPWSNLSSSCTRFVRFVVLSKIFIRFSQLVCFASTIIFLNGQILHFVCARSPSIRKNGTNRGPSSSLPWSQLSLCCIRFFIISNN